MDIQIDCDELAELELKMQSSIKYPEIPTNPIFSNYTTQVNTQKTNGKIFVNGYELLETIGQGRFGKVKKVQKMEINNEGNKISTFYAMKVYKRQSLQKARFNSASLDLISGVQVVNNQINIIKILNHKNIAKFYDIIDDQSHKQIYIIMEYCDLGQIMDVVYLNQEYCYIKNQKVIQYFMQNYQVQDMEIIAKIIFKQVCQAVQYMHNTNISNRDIKVDNIVIKQQTKGSEVKIIDFNTARYSTHNDISYQTLGTPGFMCPQQEQVSEQGYLVKASDIWGIGKSLYLFLFETLQLTYSEQTNEIIFPQNNFSNELIKLLKCMLTNQKERITIYQVLKSNWFVL